MKRETYRCIGHLLRQRKVQTAPENGSKRSGWGVTLH